MTRTRHYRRRRREREKRGCKDKVRYATLYAAVQAAVKHNLTWYHCIYCGGYHLTSRKEMK